MLRRLWLTLMRSLRSPISWRFQSRAASLRCGHDPQCAPPQRRCRGDVVTILGIGGLGLLGVQFANSLGFRTVAITRHRQGGALLKLGAHALLHRQRDRRRDGGIQPFRRSATPVTGKCGRWRSLGCPQRAKGAATPFPRVRAFRSVRRRCRCCPPPCGHPAPGSRGRHRWPGIRRLGRRIGKVSRLKACKLCLVQLCGGIRPRLGAMGMEHLVSAYHMVSVRMMVLRRHRRACV